MSDAAATAWGESDQSAPWSSNGCALDFVREWTVTGWPLASTWPHIERPMTPVPTQPMRVEAETGVGTDVLFADMGYRRDHGWIDVKSGNRSGGRFDLIGSGDQNRSILRRAPYGGCQRCENDAGWNRDRSDDDDPEAGAPDGGSDHVDR